MGKVRSPIVTRADARQLIVEKAGKNKDLERFCRAELAATFNTWVSQSKHEDAVKYKAQGTLIQALDLYGITGVLDLYINIVFEQMLWEKDPLYTARYSSGLHAIEERMVAFGKKLNLEGLISKKA